MTATYHHDHVNAFNNPSPLTHDALTAAADALDHAARGMGPLARANPHRIDAPHDTVLPIMGAKLSPSPELQSGGAGVLDVDYADGSTRTFDVDGETGEITPRRYAYAFAAVIETDEPLTEDRESTALAFIGDTFLNCEAFSASIEFASTPARVPYRPHDDYDVQPRDESAGGRNR